MSRSNRFLAVCAFFLLALHVPLATSSAGSGTDSQESTKLLIPHPVPDDPALAECTVHLVIDDLSRPEQTVPCGDAVAVKAGTWRFWLEAEKAGQPWISRTASGFTTGQTGQPLSPPDLLTLAPAGRLALASVPAHATHVELLALPATDAPALQRFELRRRVPLATLRDGVSMPEGNVLALLFDEEKKEYRALSPVLNLRAGQILTLTLDPPHQVTSLLAILDRQDALTAAASDDVELLLELADGAPALRPEVVARFGRRLFGVWHGLDQRGVRLRAKSETVFLEAQDLLLRPGRVEATDGVLRRLPTLRVVLELPDALRQDVLRLQATTPQDRAVLRTLELLPDAMDATFERLPPAKLEVALFVGSWRFREAVDLTDGEDHELVIAPQPLTLSGTVYRGDEEYPATIAFVPQLDSDTRLTVETDEDGHYETVLYRDGTLPYEVRLRGYGGPPFVGWIMVPETAHHEHDFHVPAAQYRVKVLDARTGAPVADAEIMANNRSEELTTSQRATSDEMGLAELQPLRPGEVSVIVTAEDYLSSPPRTEPVLDDDEHHEILIELEPAGERLSWHLQLADGRPAGQAEVRAQRDLGGRTFPIWSGQSDAEGKIEIPSAAVGAFLLVRHPQAGSDLLYLAAQERGRVWRLPVPAEPLTLNVRDSWGQPLRWAGVAVWIGGYRISDAVLGWLTYSRSAADGRGIWQGRSLPAVSTQILAWKGERSAEALAGMFDPLATPLAWPWPSVVDIEAIE